jgi:hypothetical protein
VTRVAARFTLEKEGVGTGQTMVLAGGPDEYMLGREHAIGLLDVLSEVTA